MQRICEHTCVVQLSAPVSQEPKTGRREDQPTSLSTLHSILDFLRAILG
jgi:hypothetical protein